MPLSIRIAPLLLGLFISVLVNHTSLRAQALVINPNSINEIQRGQLLSAESFFVNGPFTKGLSDEMANSSVRLGPVGRTLLTLTALRMEAAGLISLDEPIEPVLPHLLEEHPFKVAVTPRFILTETAGFSIPVFVTKAADFQYYLTSVRTPGKMAQPDSVGWALLFDFLSKKGGKPTAELIHDHLLAPLNLPAESLQISPNGNSLWRVQEMRGTGKLIAEVARIMIRNRAADGSRFLSLGAHSSLTREYAWRLHPLGATHTLGGQLRYTAGRAWLSPPEEIAASKNGVPLPGASFIAFPDQGIAFINFSGLSGGFQKAVHSLTQAKFLPPAANQRMHDANRIPVSRHVSFRGSYVRTDTITAWLRNRLNAVATQTISVRDPGVTTGASSLFVRKGNTPVETEYKTVAPFYFKASNGSTLIFSTYLQGSYMVLDDIQYRHVGLLGSKFVILDLIPYVFIILLTSVFYSRSKVNATWRNMGRVGFLGTLLVMGGIACEYFQWQHILFDLNLPWLVVLWRSLFNIGLMCTISLPMYVLLINKTRLIPNGIAMMFVPLHLALISFAAIALLVIMLAWGIAGEFGPY